MQFDHRVLATSTLLCATSVWVASRSLPLPPPAKLLLNALLGMTALQVRLTMCCMHGHSSPKDNEAVVKGSEAHNVCVANEMGPGDFGCVHSSGVCTCISRISPPSRSTHPFYHSIDFGTQSEEAASWGSCSRSTQLKEIRCVFSLKSLKKDGTI